MSSCSFSCFAFPSNSTLSHMPMEATSVSGSPSTLTEDDNFSVSFEGSSCPTDTQVDLGLKGPRGFEVSSVDDSSSSSSSSSVSSMAMTNGHVVGWPPIRRCRMKSKVSWMLVKVTMDGIPIGRKIDLKAHRSYDSLSTTLEGMFMMKLSQLQHTSSEFVLTYKDKEGDWMLVGDVPWGMFVGSVRRLRIMTTSEATGRAQTIT